MAISNRHPEPNTQSKSAAAGYPTATVSSSREQTWADHAVRQLKFVLPGAAITYYLGTVNDFLAVVQGTGGSLGQTVAYLASGLGLTTVSLFLFVLFMPWLIGEEPNYQTWRESGTLSSIIPLLTGSIVIGWTLAVGTLGEWSRLGYLKGSIGVSAVYAMTFGLLGLIPAPKTRKSKSN